MRFTEKKFKCNPYIYLFQKKIENRRLKSIIEDLIIFSCTAAVIVQKDSSPSNLCWITRNQNTRRRRPNKLQLPLQQQNPVQKQNLSKKTYQLFPNLNLKKGNLIDMIDKILDVKKLF